MIKKKLSVLIQEAHCLVDEYIDSLNEGIASSALKAAQEIAPAMRKKQYELLHALTNAKKSGDSKKITELMGKIKLFNMLRNSTNPQKALQIAA